MKKFLIIIRQSFMDSLAYSVSTFVWFVIAILEVLVPMIIWLSATPINETFGGFSKFQILTYYALITVIGNITFWWIHFGIADKIRTGDLSNLLVKPMSVLEYFVQYQIGEKLFSFLMRLPLFIGIFYFFREFIHVTPAAFVAMMLGACVSLLICLLFSTLAFYLTDLGGFVGLFYFTSYLFSGELAPLSFYPAWFSQLAHVMPFRYIFSFTVEILMQKLTSNQILVGFLIQGFWLLVLGLALKIVWKRAIGTYQAYGK